MHLTIITVLTVCALIASSNNMHFVNSESDYGPVKVPTELVKSAKMKLSYHIEEIERMEESMNSTFFILKNEMKKLLIWNETKSHLSIMSPVYNEFLKDILPNNGKVNRNMSEIVKWSSDILNKNKWQRKFINQLLYYVRRKHLFYGRVKTYPFSCEFRISQNQLFYHYYEILKFYFRKAYITTQFALYVLRDQKHNEDKYNASYWNGIFKKRENLMYNDTAEIISKSDNYIWTCDPKKHLKGATYKEINILKGTNINLTEYELPRLSWLSGLYTKCSRLPNYLKIKTIYKKHNKEFQKYVFNCKSVPSQSEYGQCFCIEQLANSRDQKIIVYNSIFSSKITANTTENRVITGLRFVQEEKCGKATKFTYLQIQDGVLLSNGRINATSIKWQSLNKEYCKSKEPKAFRLNYINRTIALDSIMEKNENIYDGEPYVATGVQLDNAGSGEVKLLVNYMRFKFATGKLVPGSSKWIDNTVDKTTKRKLITLDDTDISTKSPSPSRIMYPNSLIKFEVTGGKDRSQTTIPLLDIQDVTSRIPAPLCGAGIYYKGHEGYGGFLAPKIMPCDFSRIRESTTFYNVSYD